MANLCDYTLERIARVEKTSTYPSLNEPVLLFNRFRIYEISGSLGLIVVFGVIRSNWLLTLLTVSMMLIGSPTLRKRLPPSYIYRKYLDCFSKISIGPFTWGQTKSSF